MALDGRGSDLAIRFLLLSYAYRHAEQSRMSIRVFERKLGLSTQIRKQILFISCELFIVHYLKLTGQCILLLQYMSLSIISDPSR